MFTETFQSIVTATRQLFRNWQSTLMLAAIYAALLATLYFFATLREASIAQVILTFALAITAPILFFELQALSANGTSELKPRSLFKKSLSDSWRLVLITLPVIALAVLAVYLLGKIQAHFGAGVKPATELYDPYPMATMAQAQTAAGKQPVNWRIATVTSIRFLVLGLALPLALIHLWIATVQTGVGTTIRQAKDNIARAFAPQSVLIYMSGLVVFGVIPYLLLFKATPTKHAWLELASFVGRLAVVFGLTLFDWVITMGALSISRKKSLQVPAKDEM